MNIGVTVDSKRPSETTKNIVKSLISLDCVKEVKLLKIRYSETPRSFNLNWSLLQRAERLLNRVIAILQKFGLLPSIEINIQSFNDSDFETIELEQKRRGFFSYTSANNLDSADLDFIIRGCGLGIEKGELLKNGSRLGLFGIHHGDNRLYRGGPAGFWECITKTDSLGIIFQKYTKELDGGLVLARARLHKGLTWTENIKILEAHVPAIIEKGIRSINISNNTISSPLLDFGQRRLYKNPKISQIFYYLFLSIKKIIIKASSILWRKLLMKADCQKKLLDNWQIMIIKNSGRIDKPWDMLKMDSQQWFADPFYSSFNGGLLLCEKYDRKRKKAFIVSFALKGGKIDYTSETILIDNGVHASYPYTFEANGSHYVMPEEGNLGINIYELKQKNGKTKVQFIRNILPAGYVEPSLIFLDNEYWIFANKGVINGQKNILELFTTPDIKNSQLEPYSLNPVLIDSKIGRGAGRLFLNGNELHRPAQDGLSYYGRSLHFTFSDTTRENFQFKELNKISSHKKNSQIHHFDYWEEGGDTFMLLDMNQVTLEK